MFAFSCVASPYRKHSTNTRKLWVEFSFFQYLSQQSLRKANTCSPWWFNSINRLVSYFKQHMFNPNNGLIEDVIFLNDKTQPKFNTVCCFPFQAFRFVQGAFRSPAAISLCMPSMFYVQAVWVGFISYGTKAYSSCAAVISFQTDGMSSLLNWPILAGGCDWTVIVNSPYAAICCTDWGRGQVYLGA